MAVPLLLMRLQHILQLRAEIEKKKQQALKLERGNTTVTI
jgi:hypothetical protein